MQLVNMDVERHGSFARTQLGPFSSGLNAICGPKGAGKTTLLNWLRQIAIDSAASEPLSAAAPLAGRIELINRGHRWQLPDRGRSFDSHLNGNQLGNLSQLQREVFAALASASGATDTEAALESVATRFGIDVPPPVIDMERDTLLARQRDIEGRLYRLRSLTTSRESLITRRQELERELHQSLSSRPTALRSERSPGYAGYALEHQRYDNRMAMIEDDLRDTLAQIEGYDRQLADLRAELKVNEVSKTSVVVDDSYRVQLQEIDDRLTRWRQTLRDLKAHRNRIEHDATDARLDKQVGEQLSTTKEPDPRGALRSLEAQILSARRQLDQLVDRYSVLQDVRPDQYSVQRDALGRTSITYDQAGHRYAESNNLPETLRSMQKDLYEACQQLARHQSRAANETLKQQSEQLQRCETELLHSVEKLIEERAQLLRKIANEYQLSSEQLSLAFGNWCDCHDHTHLQDWLLNETEVKTTRMGHDPLARQGLLERIAAIESQRKIAQGHAENCKRQLRDGELGRRVVIEHVVGPHGRPPVEIQRELDQVQNELREWDDRDKLLAEADELRRQLVATRPVLSRNSAFRDRVHWHIAGLMGGRGHLPSHSSYRYVAEVPQRRYDLVDGIVYDSAAHHGEPAVSRHVEAQVPAALVRVAFRLAIAEAMAARSEPISLVFDEGLDHLSPELQQAALAHLAQVAAGSQQVILLTGDQRVADLVQSHRGWIGYLDRQTVAVPDINRHLTALANDYESDKWYDPTLRHDVPPTTTMRGEFYLTERSRVEDSPSIDALTAARCRAVGVDRIGDLLDVDPNWLAEQLRLNGVTEATVASWQAEARLLCSVRQLRPFDARLLVAIGIRTPQQLGRMHPSQLLSRVEQFVATDRGRRLLRSGNSYELSRITNWIASAKGGTAHYSGSNFSDNYQSNEFDFDDIGPIVNNARTGRAANRGASRRLSESEYIPSDADDRLRRSSRRRDRDTPILNGSDSSRRNPRSESLREPRTPREHQPGSRVNRRAEPLKLAPADFSHVDSDSRHKFYLELASPVVDAPSIGPRLAERIAKSGIHTVAQLLAANAEGLADKLNMRRVDATTIRDWQEQARLVCRIPNLRGHDAQLLVACNLTSPEELAAMNASSVLSQVLVIAESPEGQRILRGGKQPDLEEVSDWIRWASQSRSLHAA